MRTLHAAPILLLVGLWAPFSRAQDYVGEHLPNRAKPPAWGQLPTGLAPYAERVGAQPYAEGTVDSLFDRLVDEALAALLAFDPVQATELGFHQYDAMLPDADSTALLARRDTLGWLDIRLWSLGPSSKVRRADQLLLSRALKASRPRSGDPVYYVDVASRGIRSLLVTFAPLEDRASNVIARVNAIGPFLRSGRTNLEGVPVSRADAVDAIARSKDLVAFLSNTLPVAMKDVKDPVLREEFGHHLAQAAGAAADYHDWLVSEVLPRASGAPVPRAGPDMALAELVRR